MANATQSAKVWKKFKRNTLALIGLIFIVLMVIIGVLGYLITPDQTPYANTQQLQIGKEKPGSKFKFLIIQRYNNVKDVGFFEKMLYGQPAKFKSVPITSYKIVNDEVYAYEYIGEEKNTTPTVYKLKELCHSCILPSKLGNTQMRFEQQNIYEQKFWLGTDVYGRDLLSRLILGVRVSLSVGLMAVLISMFIGVGLGAIAGYFGGKIDAAISWFMNVI